MTRIARITVQACDMSLAALSLVGTDGRHRIVALWGRKGLLGAETLAFSDEVLRKGKPLVQEVESPGGSAGRTEAASARCFAAGMPLREPGGAPWGTLCVFGDDAPGAPRTVLAALDDLAQIVMERLRAQGARKQAEAEAATLRSFYENVLHELPIAVEVLDAEGRYVWANRAAEAESETGLDGMIGKTAEDLGRTFERNESLYRQRHEWIVQVIARKEISGVEETVTLGDGSVRHLFHVAVPVLGEDGSVDHVIGYRIDQTETKVYERELVAAIDRAEALNRLKSALLTNMNHEVRTPLTAIIGFADILSRSASPEGREFAGLIHKNGRRLMDTLNAVLDLAQLESGSMELRPMPFDLASLIREVLALYQTEADARGLHLHFEEPERPYIVIADYLAVHRIVGHLVSNALKFTERGGVTVRAEMEETHVGIRVEDTGVGISPTFTPQLFEAFTQESSGLDRNFNGMGLGLAVAKNLLDMMGGEILVESEKEAGSVFVVRLPRQAVNVPVGDGLPSRQRVRTASREIVEG
ncbi:sensor histidine kinase [Rhodocaloribacter sp.]